MSLITNINFPSDLPRHLKEGQGVQHGTPFLRTEMTNGRARQRRRFSSVPSQRRVSWILSSAEASAFEAWFRDQLSDGTAWFNMMGSSPLGVDTPLVCRFVEMYDGAEVFGSNLWRITARLEVFERPLLPTGWGLFPALLTQSDIIDFALNQEWPQA